MSTYKQSKRHFEEIVRFLQQTPRKREERRQSVEDGPPIAKLSEALRSC